MTTSHHHIVHKTKHSRGPFLSPSWTVWCEAGDLELTGLQADLADRWVAKHVLEKGAVKG